MNKENLLAVADMIEKGHHKFNGIHAAFKMSHWFADAKNMLCTDEETFQRKFVPHRPDIPENNECNTTACIAGWTCLMFDYEGVSKVKTSEYDFKGKAQRFLGLTLFEAERLFSGTLHPSVTGPEAAEIIRNFVKTGEIDWGPVNERLWGPH